jgi:hypothetical protein
MLEFLEGEGKWRRHGQSPMQYNNSSRLDGRSSHPFISVSWSDSPWNRFLVSELFCAEDTFAFLLRPFSFFYLPEGQDPGSYTVTLH